MDLRGSEYIDFKKEFWYWFDNLPRERKESFWNYPYDASETNFFFTVWEKKNENQIYKR